MAVGLSNVGALIIRTGFGGFLIIFILIIVKASTVPNKLTGVISTAPSEGMRLT